MSGRPSAPSTRARPQSTARISTMALVPTRTTASSFSSSARLACSSRSDSRSAASGRPANAAGNPTGPAPEAAPEAAPGADACAEPPAATVLEFPLPRGDRMIAGWPRFDLYVITDSALPPGRPHLEIARAALAGGADAVQLRDKGAAALNLCAAAAEIQPLARKFGAVFIVNDRVDVALVAGADGAHVGQGDLPARDARRLLPRPAILGVSCGTPQEARRAAKDGADYIGVGPVFATG